MAAVPYRPIPGAAPVVTPAWEAELRRVIELDPHEVGVASALWTTGLLADLPGQADRSGDERRDGAPVPASPRLCLQAAQVDAQAQGRGGAGLGGKRLRVEVLLAAGRPALAAAPWRRRRSTAASTPPRPTPTD